MSIDYVAKRQGFLNGEHYSLWLISQGERKDPVLSPEDAVKFLGMFPPRKNIILDSSYDSVFSEEH